MQLIGCLLRGQETKATVSTRFYGVDDRHTSRGVGPRCWRPQAGRHRRPVPRRWQRRGRSLRGVHPGSRGRDAASPGPAVLRCSGGRARRIVTDALPIELRGRNLGDFHAVGTLASLQAEKDAHTWLLVSRMSTAAPRSGWPAHSLNRCPREALWLGFQEGSRAKGAKRCCGLPQVPVAARWLALCLTCSSCRWTTHSHVLVAKRACWSLRPRECARIRRAVGRARRHGFVDRKCGSWMAMCVWHLRVCCCCFV